MSAELNEILKRTGSRHLSKLWSFYRDYFPDDDSCLAFIYHCLKNEPILQGKFAKETGQPGVFSTEDGITFSDDVFIPRRMLNSVERLVMAARDMEQIRRGKDIFKIVYLVTCIETLQKLSGKDKSKKDLLFSFFEDYVSDEDKSFISKRFKHDDEDSQTIKNDSFKQFVGVINEYRNCAAHEGDYWNYCFNNNADRDTWPIQFILKIDLTNFSPNNKKEHCFHTQLSYNDFETIFIRACITFIKKYVDAS